MNHVGCRPYYNTCGINKPCRNIKKNFDDETVINRECCVPLEKEDINTEEPLNNFPLAMAYVPCQHFSDTFQLNYALNVGTIFPELCKPFCGRRWGCR